MTTTQSRVTSYTTSRYPVLFATFLITLCVPGVLAKGSKKAEKFFLPIGGGCCSSDYSSSEEDFPFPKWNFDGIFDFFNRGPKHCGKLGRRILKDTHRLFHPAAGGIINRRRVSHHLSHLYSRYADCCD